MLNKADSLLDNTQNEVKPIDSTQKHISYEENNFTIPEGINANTTNSLATTNSLPTINSLTTTHNETEVVPKLCITTKTYKYKLGKNKDKRQIGVLIKNRDTQKRIKKEIEQLKAQDIQTIKNHLREKGLIKLGSQAPNTILRKMYEDSILSGEISNNNSNNLVFNYLNND
jgi:hypothetical protein